MTANPNPGNVPHNPQNTLSDHPEPHSVNCVDGLGQVEKLHRELLAAGVVLAVSDAGRLSIDAPAGVMTHELLARVRADRDGLLALLRGVFPNMGSNAEPLPSSLDRCPWCGPSAMLDRPRGLRCDRCGRLAWIIDARAITRADYLDAVWA